MRRRRQRAGHPEASEGWKSSQLKGVVAEREVEHGRQYWLVGGDVVLTCLRTGRLLWQGRNPPVDPPSRGSVEEALAFYDDPEPDLKVFLSSGFNSVEEALAGCEAWEWPRECEPLDLDGALASVTDIVLSPDQEEVFTRTLQWIAERVWKPGLLRFGGYAGTGKSTVLSTLGSYLNIKIPMAFCALSGRAASVLRRKLSERGVSTTTDADSNDGHYCGTIHGLIYRPLFDKKTGRLLGWRRRDKLSHGVIIVDEASMVTKGVLQDLEAFGLPVLAVGDHGQLPPVGDSYNLMEQPDLRLEKIHRQAEDNPIIQLSSHIRQHGCIDPQLADGDRVKLIPKRAGGPYLREIFGRPLESLLDTAVLAYRNKTRQKINQVARRIRFGDDPPELPQTGDVVMCLRNLAGRAIYNGFRGYYVDEPQLVTEHHYYDRNQARVSRGPHWIKGSIQFPQEDESLEGAVSRYPFMREDPIKQFSDVPFSPRCWDEIGPLFDFGYGMTVHKAQGSQFSEVLVLYEWPAPVSRENFQRWLYTAVTRASERLILAQ